jgi:hypothetical protein
MTKQNPVQETPAISLAEPLYLSTAKIVLQEGNGTFEIPEQDTLPCRHRKLLTPTEPVLLLGDSRWCNYQCSACVQLASSAAENFAAVGLRYHTVATATDGSGYSLRLYGNGCWVLVGSEAVLCSGTVPAFDHTQKHALAVLGIGTLILGMIDGRTVCEFQTAGKPAARSGFMWLQSALFTNTFSDITIKPLPVSLSPYCFRTACTPPQVRYLTDGVHHWAASHKGVAGCVAEIRFYGNGIFLIGRTEYAKLKLWLDGHLYTKEMQIDRSHIGEAFFTAEGLSAGWHTLRMKITEGALTMDALEIPTKNAGEKPPLLPPDSDAVTPAAPLHRGRTAAALTGTAAAGLVLSFTMSRFLKTRRK